MGRRTVILIVATLLALHLAALNDHWAVKRDSGLYLSLGRSVAEGRGMALAGRQVWGLPPAVPLMIAGCRLLVGSHYWLINLVMSLFGCGVALMTWLTVRHLSSGLPQRIRVGLAPAALLIVGFSARLFTESHRILTDVPFTFFVLLGIYGFLRGRRGHGAWYLVGAVSLAAATYTRLPGLAFFGGLMAATVVDFREDRYGRRLAATLMAAVPFVAAFLIWLLLLRPLSDPGTVDHLKTLNPGRWTQWVFLVDIGRSLARFPSAVCGSMVGQKLHGFDLALTAIILVGLYAAWRHRQHVVLLPLVLYVGVLVARHPSSIAPRYFLPIMPILAYSLLLGVGTLTAWLRPPAEPPDGTGETKVPRAKWPVTVVVVICVAISAPRIAREVYWMRHPDFYAVFEGGKWKPSLEVGEYLAGQGAPETGEVLTPNSSIIHYLSRLPARTRLQWKGTTCMRLHDLAPEEFAKAAAAGPYRFVVVPGDRGDWSGPARRCLEATGLFREVSKRFGPLVLYERVTRAETGAVQEGAPHGGLGGPWIPPKGSKA